MVLMFLVCGLLVLGAWWLAGSFRKPDPCQAALAQSEKMLKDGDAVAARAQAIMAGSVCKDDALAQAQSLQRSAERELALMAPSAPPPQKPGKGQGQKPQAGQQALVQTFLREAEAALSMGDQEKAREFLSQALRLDPQNRQAQALQKKLAN
jgi:hypothetical protein